MKGSELRTRTKMLAGANAIDPDTSKLLLQECGVIHRMLSKSITTAKSNIDSH